MLVKIRPITLAALLAVIATTAAGQYRWVDANGRVNYGDQPPGDAKGLTRIDPRGGSAEEAASALPFELRRAIAQHPVTLYTAENCGPCDAARVYLLRRGIPFSEIVVETEQEAAELKRRVGTESVPVMTLGRAPNIGFNERAWAVALDAASYPAQSQLPLTYRQATPKPLLPEPTAPANRPADPASPSKR